MRVRVIHRDGLLHAHGSYVLGDELDIEEGVADSLVREKRVELADQGDAAVDEAAADEAADAGG